MPRVRPQSTMLDMNGSLDTRRVLIPVAGPPRAGHQPAADPPAAARIRRYRLGRMPLYTRPDPDTDRFAHLRHGYD